MDKVSSSKKPGVAVISHHYCDQFELVPIKKRMSFRESAIYQPTPSSTKVLDQNLSSPSLSTCTDPYYLLNQPSDNLITNPLDADRSPVVVFNNEKADCSPDFTHTETLTDSTPGCRMSLSDNGNKVLNTEVVPPCTDSRLSLASSFASDAKNDDFGTKISEHVKHLSSDITRVSHPDEILRIHPDPRSDQKAVHSVTQKVRIFWDLNIQMDEWEKPIDHKNVESMYDVASFEFWARKSESLKLKEKTITPVNIAEYGTQPICTCLNSGSVCKQNHATPGSAYSLVCESLNNDQQVAASTCHDRTFSDKEPSLETESTTTSCNQKPSSKTDEHAIQKLGESASKTSADEPKKDSENLFETTSWAESTELQDCGNKNIAYAGKNFNVDNGTSKKRTVEKGDQFMDSSDHCLDLLKRQACFEVENHMDKLSGNATLAFSMHHPSDGMTKDLCGNVVENQTLDSFQEGCDISISEPLCFPRKCRQDATSFNQVVTVDNYCGLQTEQDYEDGELRDMDMHCWNGMETECLDYEPVAADNTENIYESSSSVSVVGNDEDRLKRKTHKSSETLRYQVVANDSSNANKKMISRLCSDKTHLSNRQLERKLSGWDQLSKDDPTSLEKVLEAHRESSIISRSKSQGWIGVSTLSEDVEKETVAEQWIRPKDLDSSHSMEDGSGFDKFNGKSRSIPHMPGRNRVEDWYSEHRSSANFHDIYDNLPGPRHLNSNFKGHEYLRSEAYDSRINHSRGRYGRHAEGSRRTFRGVRSGYRGSLTDDHGESVFMRQLCIKRGRTFSPRKIPHFSENFGRSHPVWLPRYERMGLRHHHRSAEFGTEDIVKGSRLPFWESTFPSDKESHFASPSQGTFIHPNKLRWNDDYDMGSRRDRSPVRQFCLKEKFNAACSYERFKSSEDFIPLGSCARMREFASLNRDRGYIGGSDRRKHEYSLEAGHPKHFYKDGYARQYQPYTEDTEAQNCPSNVDFPENEEETVCSARQNENISRERNEYGQQNYPGSTPNVKA